jgi:type IV pilus assembly protein PilO
MAKKLNINMQNLPPVARIAIALIPTVVIAVAFYFVAYKPNSGKIKKLNADIVAQEKEIAKNEAKVAKLPEVKKRYAELEYSLKILSQQLPEENEVSDLLKKISDYGVKSGLQILLWKPGPRKTHPSNIVYTVPVSVNMAGTYHNLGSFFSRLTSLDRIVNIKDIKMNTKGGKKLGMLSITFRTETFSAIPLAERDKSKDKPSGKKKKKRRK